MQSSKAGLILIATPLGNPGDLSPRARQALKNADIVLAEDTRRAAILFRACELPQRKFLSFHEHNEQLRQEKILSEIMDGKCVALISDAGTPLVADPGYRLVRECKKRNIKVTSIPGPSAPICALSLAGIPPLPFTFLGFLPRAAKSRKDIFRQFRDIPGALVFFERKDRLFDSLLLAHEILGQRELAICRELTKEHEEIIFGTLGYPDESWKMLLGELTVVIGPGSAERTDEREMEKLLAEVSEKHPCKKEMIRLIREKTTGWSGKEIYSFAAAIGRNRNIP